MEIRNLGTSIKDQSKFLNYNHHNPKTKQKIIEFIDRYGDFKTILNLHELLSTSSVTRSKTIPRPQNAWVLFRRNLSKGLNLTVGETSEIASCLWKKKSVLEAQFWNELSQITKEIHLIEYPDYKYSPLRSNKQNKKSIYKQNNNLKISLSKNYFEPDYNSEIDVSTTIKEETDDNISPDIDINMSEIDIEMAARDLFQSTIYDSSLYNSNTALNDPFFYDPSLLDFVDPYLKDPSLSFIDPSFISNPFVFSNNN